MAGRSSFARFLSFICISIVFLPCLAFSHRNILNSSQNCSDHASRCGALTVRSPFYLKGSRPTCGNKSFELTCQGSTDLMLSFDMSGSTASNYKILEIFYENQTLRLVDQQLADADCPKPDSGLDSETINKRGFRLSPSSATGAFLECWDEVHDPTYLQLPCSMEKKYSYFHVGSDSIDQIKTSCSPHATVPLMGGLPAEHLTVEDVKKYLRTGFLISWATTGSPPRVVSPPKSNNSSKHQGETSLGILHLFAVIVYVLYGKCRQVSAKKKLRHTHETLGTCRYSYSDIKKMTSSFKEKLGQGGFGSVYKGRLGSGQLIAVKMLEKSKKNGEEFISEVTTIGSIHHVNVVRLVGFCAEGSRCALVYEFMPNGSLEKYIFSNVEMGNEISWEKLFEIALGVAHGIDYLHRGCNMRILHFDIKPHNILLDDNFNPKISDFGLAKLCPSDLSIVSMSNARGTPGYMAPELISKDFGSISYKSDVYSFGMLLLEIAGRRKNVNPHVDHSSQIYFPTWVYEKLALEWNTKHGDAAAKVEGEISKKLAMVGLWCIQMNPEKRPSMSRAVEMLEGSIGALEMPPKPFLTSPERPPLEDISLSENDSISCLRSLSPD
ncbi:hypothetical protein ACLOJK_032868 [Asimina triloba]